MAPIEDQKLQIHHLISLREKLSEQRQSFINIQKALKDTASNLSDSKRNNAMSELRSLKILEKDEVWPMKYYKKLSF